MMALASRSIVNPEFTTDYCFIVAEDVCSTRMLLAVAAHSSKVTHYILQDGKRQVDSLLQL